jgi:hypothetical protein
MSLAFKVVSFGNPGTFGLGFGKLICCMRSLGQSSSHLIQLVAVFGKSLDGGLTD